jgi:hypothetical protein
MRTTIIKERSITRVNHKKGRKQFKKKPIRMKKMKTKKQMSILRQTFDVNVLVNVLQHGNEFGILQKTDKQFKGITAHQNHVLVITKQRSQLILSHVLRFENIYQLLHIWLKLILKFCLVALQE